LRERVEEGFGLFFSYKKGEKSEEQSESVWWKDKNIRKCQRKWLGLFSFGFGYYFALSIWEFEVVKYVQV
jgi:hypothetical protein